MKKNTSQNRFFLIELIINSLFFFLLMATGLGIFAQSFLYSNQSRAYSNSTLKVQFVAEAVKAAKGDDEMLAEIIGAENSENLQIYFDENWLSTTQENCLYILNVIQNVDDEDMLSANITVETSEEIIFETTILHYLENREVAN